MAQWGLPGVRGLGEGQTRDQGVRCVARGLLIGRVMSNPTITADLAGRFPLTLIFLAYMEARDGWALDADPARAAVHEHAEGMWYIMSAGRQATQGLGSMAFTRGWAPATSDAGDLAHHSAHVGTVRSHHWM